MILLIYKIFIRSLSLNYLNSQERIPIRYNQEIVLQHSTTKLISSIFVIRKIEGKTRVILEEERKKHFYKRKKYSSMLSNQENSSKYSLLTYFLFNLYNLLIRIERYYI